MAKSEKLARDRRINGRFEILLNLTYINCILEDILEVLLLKLLLHYLIQLDSELLMINTLLPWAHRIERVGSLDNANGCSFEASRSWSWLLGSLRLALQVPKGLTHISDHTDDERASDIEQNNSQDILEYN